MEDCNPWCLGALSARITGAARPQYPTAAARTPLTPEFAQNADDSRAKHHQHPAKKRKGQQEEQHDGRYANDQDRQARLVVSSREAVELGRAEVLFLEHRHLKRIRASERTSSDAGAAEDHCRLKNR